MELTKTSDEGVKDNNLDWPMLKASKFCAIKQVPSSVLNKNVFMYFTSKELFKLRGVCSDWSDSIKAIWC